MLNKYELKQKCKHILDYGENWGFMHVRGEIQWRERSIREKEKDMQEMRTELQAYKKLLSKMQEKRELKKLVKTR